MNKKSGLMVLLLVLLTGALIFSGCDNKNKNNKNVTTNGQENSNDNNSALDSNDDKRTNESNIDDNKNNDSANTNTEQTTTPETKIELPIYCIDENTLETIASVATIPANSEITPELIVNEVVKKFAEIELIVKVDSITTQKDTIIVSFKADAAPFLNVGAGVEGSILDSIGMSLIDNMKEYKKVIFRKEGKAYESGHIILGIDEVYIEN